MFKELNGFESLWPNLEKVACFARFTLVARKGLKWNNEHSVAWANFVGHEKLAVRVFSGFEILKNVVWFVWINCNVIVE